MARYRYPRLQATVLVFVNLKFKLQIIFVTDRFSTLVLLNCLRVFFIHLELELLTQFLASIE